MQLPTDAPNTVFEALSRAARRHGAKPLVAVLPETAQAYGIDAGEITYAELLSRVSELAHAYRAGGYGHGHRVGLLMENRPAFFLHWFALNSLGVSVVPINPDLRLAELEYLIGHSDIIGAVAIPSRHTEIAAAATAAGRTISIARPDEVPAIAPTKAPRAGAPGRDSECALLYTSGTSGRPKGCVLPNEYFLYAGHWYATVGGLIDVRDGGERMLTPLPLFHMNAMACSTMAMILTGGCLTVLDRFHPRSWWASVRESGATIVHYLGVMPPMLMGAPASPGDRAHKVRFGFGAGVDRRLHDAFEARFGFPLVEAWAMTETGAGAEIAASREPRHTGQNCFGRPGPEVEVRVVRDDGAEAGVDEQGELLVRHSGPQPRYGFFREYLKDPDATAAAWEGGWFHTGDVVRRGSDGSMYFVDRKKNVIRRSGENISAVEVESVLMQHPAVGQVAVASAPDPVRGDEVLAFIVAAEHPADHGAGERLATEITAWCLTRLAYFKVPGYIAFVDALPLTSTQKIKRGDLKDLMAATVGTASCFDMRRMKKRTAA